MIKVRALTEDDDFPHVTFNIYLHGILDCINGYDLVYIEDSLPSMAGEYPCEVYLKGEDMPIPAIFFYWRVNDRDRGLIVKYDDYENLVYARSKYEERSISL